MAIVKCEACGHEFDETYCNTCCPHPFFAMDMEVRRSDGAERRRRSLDELQAFLVSATPSRSGVVEFLHGAAGERHAGPPTAEELGPLYARLHTSYEKELEHGRDDPGRRMRALALLQRMTMAAIRPERDSGPPHEAGQEVALCGEWGTVTDDHRWVSCPECLIHLQPSTAKA